VGERVTMDRRQIRSVRIWGLIVLLALLLAIGRAAAEGYECGGASGIPCAQETVVPSRPGGQSTRPLWIGEACKDEFSSVCGYMPLNSRKDDIIDCLKAHPESVSRDCSQAISARTPTGQSNERRGRGLGHRGNRMGDGASADRGPYGTPAP
jgi:hypothetical protein